LSVFIVAAAPTEALATVVGGERDNESDAERNVYSLYPSITVATKIRTLEPERLNYISMENIFM